MTTIGYGNYVPESVGGKLFCLVYMCFGIPYFAYLTTIVSENINNFLGRLEIRALGVSNLRSCSIIRQLYIVGGIFIIVILPSLFFAKVEGNTRVILVFWATLVINHYIKPLYLKMGSKVRFWLANIIIFRVVDVRLVVLLANHVIDYWIWGFG